MPGEIREVSGEGYLTGRPVKWKKKGMKSKEPLFRNSTAAMNFADVKKKRKENTYSQ